MKRILAYISSIIVAGVATVSCNLNTIPEFNDKDAFVSFPKTAVTFDEDAGTVKIPVTLASVSGISTKVTYEAVDGEGDKGAVAGTNYNLVNPEGVLQFDAKNRTCYIEVEIINIPKKYLGDKTFSLRLKSTGSVAAGEESQCNVTITDLDHPLLFLTGDYAMTGGNGEAWTMNVRTDKDDISVLWFFNLPNFASGWAAEDMLYHGVVDLNSKKITFPLKQEAEYKYGADKLPVYLVAVEKVEGGSIYFEDEGKLEATFSEDGSVLEFDENFGVGSLIKDTGFVGYALKPVTGEKVK